MLQLLQKMDQILVALTEKQKRYGSEADKAAREAAKALKEQERAAREAAKAAAQAVKEQEKAAAQAAKASAQAAKEQAKAAAQVAKEQEKAAKEQAKAAAQAAKVAEQAAKEQAKASEQATKEQERLRKAIADTYTETIKTSSGFKTIKTEVNAFGETVRQTTTDSEKQGNTLRKITTIFDAITGKTKTSDSVMRDYSQSLLSTVATSGSLSGAITQAASAFGPYGQAVSIALSLVGKFTGAMSALHTKVMQIAAPFQGAAASLKGFLGDDAKAAIDLAQELGAKTRYTATEAANAAVELAKSGMASKQLLDTLPAALKSAETNSIGVAKAAKIAAVGVNQFRASGESAQNILSIYGAAANSSATGIENLAAAMKNAAPSASILGLNASKTATFLAMFANSGMEAGRAGNQLRIAFETVAKQSPRTQKALQQLGIDISQINFDEPTQWLDLFQQGLSTIPTRIEKIKVMSEVFGEAARSMIPLVEGGSAGFEEMASKIEAARGQLDQFQELKADTMTGAMAKFNSAVESVYIRLSELVSIPIQEFWSNLAQIVGTVSERIKGIGDAFNQEYDRLRSDGKSKLDAWIGAMRTLNFREIWKGLTASIQPEIDTIVSLFSNGVQMMTSFFVESFAPVGMEIGKALAVAIWAEVKQIPGMLAGLMKSAAKGGLEAVGGGVIIDTYEWIKNKVSGKGKEAAPEMPAEPGTVIDAAVEAATQEMPAVTTGLPARTPEDLQKDRVEELEIGKKQFEDAQKLVDLEKQITEAREQSKNALHEATLEINKSGEALEKWLIAPFDKFQAMVLSVKQQFGEIISGLKEKSIAIGEKFGLVSGEDANKQRQDLLQKDLKGQEKLLELAQTPEEKRAILEQMAGKSEALAGLMPEGQQGDLAKQAQGYLADAAKAAEQQMQDKIKEAEISKKFAQENVGEYEKMLANTETAGGKAGILGQLQDMYMSLGQTDKAIETQQALKQAKTQEAVEMAENSKKQVEYLQTLVELTKLLVNKNGGDSGGLDMPEDDAYSQP